MTFKPCMTALALAVAATSLGVHAQENHDVKKISEWNYDSLYEGGGIRADNLMDTEVFGPEGEEIGSVENVIIGEGDRIVAVIAQVGGFWDMGDTHVAVPWEEVELTDDGVQIPVSEDNADDYGVFENEHVTKEELQYTTQVDDDVETGYRTWKLTDFLDDYASLEGGVGYGYVENVIFSKDGQMEAVVIQADSAFGGDDYAYPFYGYDYNWDPGYATYELPYDENEVNELETFDYDQFDDTWEWDS
ncbi:MAG TPA: PRC-barrel domain-containing protein [Marinobacter sp.]